MADDISSLLKKPIQVRGQRKLYPNADEEWQRIGVGMMELFERAGDVARFVEIGRAMGIKIIAEPANMAVLRDYRP